MPSTVPGAVCRTVGGMVYDAAPSKGEDRQTEREGGGGVRKEGEGQRKFHSTHTVIDSGFQALNPI